MNEDMNRFDYNTEGKICDYGYEEPKVLSEQEILEELNHLENTKNHFWEECEDMNWQNECLQEEVEVLEKALELACKNSAFEDTCEFCEYKDHLKSIYGCPCYCETEQGFELEQAKNYFITKAKEMMKSE